jgi:hypothetical protein
MRSDLISIIPLAIAQMLPANSPTTFGLPIPSLSVSLSLYTVGIVQTACRLVSQNMGGDPDANIRCLLLGFGAGPIVGAAHMHLESSTSK